MSALQEFVTRYNVNAGFYGWERIDLDNANDRAKVYVYASTDLEDPNMHKGRTPEGVAEYRAYLLQVLQELENIG